MSEKIELIVRPKGEMWLKPTAQECALDVKRRQEEFAKVPKHILELMKKEWAVKFTMANERHIDVVTGKELHEEPVDTGTNLSDQAHLVAEQVLASKVVNDEMKKYKPTEYDKALIDIRCKADIEKKIKKLKSIYKESLFTNLESYIDKGMEFLPAVQRCLNDWQTSHSDRLLDDKTEQRP